jgi:hypothetical protein
MRRTRLEIGTFGINIWFDVMSSSGLHLWSLKTDSEKRIGGGGGAECETLHLRGTQKFSSGGAD